MKCKLDSILLLPVDFITNWKFLELFKKKTFVQDLNWAYVRENSGTDREASGPGSEICQFHISYS